MKTLPLAALLGAALLVGASTIARAQIGESPADFPLGTLSRTPKNIIAIKLKYAKSASIAYQLDPANNPRPATLGAEASPKSTEDAAFTLPDGIAQIVSVDPQNTLLIAYKEGGEQSVRDLQTLIEILDQPLRQIEIETQIVEMSPDDANSFDIDFGPQQHDAKDEFAPQIGLVKSGYTARLNALIANNKAKIIGSPHVALGSTFSGQLILRASQPLQLTAVAGGDSPCPLIILTPELKLKVAANLKDDDTLDFKIEVTSETAPTNGATTTKSLLSGNVNLRDGESWALKNLPFPGTPQNHQNYTVPLLGDIPIIGKLFRSKSLTPTQTLVFVTARITRRADETK